MKRIFLKKNINLFKQNQNLKVLPRLSLKIILLPFFITLFYFLTADLVSAQIVINEFSSAAGSSSDPDYPDWVEVYFTNEDLSLYQLRDSSGNIKNLSQASCSANICTIDWSNKLNNSGDTIELILITSPDSPVDSITYGGEGNICLPEHGQSIGRVTTIDPPYAPTNTWERFSVPSKGQTNNNGTLSPCPSPTVEPTITPTPTKIPTPTKTPTFTPSPTSKLTKIITHTPVLSKDDENQEELNKDVEDLKKDQEELVLGYQEDLDAKSKPEVEVKSDRKEKSPLIAFVVMGVGFVFLLTGIYPFVKRKLVRVKLEDVQEGKDKENG